MQYWLVQGTDSSLIYTVRLKQISISYFDKQCETNHYLVRYWLVQGTDSSLIYTVRLKQISISYFDKHCETNNYLVRR